MDLSLTYADIALVPRYESTIESRDEVDPSTLFLRQKLKLPVMSAPMKTITGSRMANELVRLGCCPVLARTNNFEEDLENFRQSASGTIPSIGATDDAIWKAEQYKKAGATAICIDTANGFHSTVAEVVKKIKPLTGLKIIAGNIGSVEGYRFMHNLCVDAVRCGIGNGSVCSTSTATGIGMGQVSLLLEIAKYKNIQRLMRPMPFPYVIADGGIKEPGDVCKALALGADTVMIGGLFAGTDETPGRVMYHDEHTRTKKFAGEASRSTKGDSAKYVEGVSIDVPCKGPVANIIQEIEDGFRSSMAYMNCRNLEEFRGLEDSCFVRLSTNARLERLPITQR